MKRKQSTIGKQLAIIQGISVISLLVVAGGGLWGLSKLNSALSTGTIQSSNEALRNVMTADMMHDALRADVLNALLSANVKNQEGLSSHESIQKDLDEHAATFEQMLSATAALPLPEEIHAAQRNVEPALTAYVESARSIVAAAANSKDGAFEGLPKFMEAFEALETQNEKWSELIETTATTAQSDALALSFHSMLVIIGAFFVALVGGSLSAFSISRSLKRRLFEVEVELRDTSDCTRRSGDDVQRISHNVFEASTEQAAAVQETVASMAEISSMIAQTNDNAKRSLEKAAQVAEKSEEGTVTMNRMVESMQSVQEANAQLFEIVNIINQISEKTQVINDIVFKTQLLSFNASIEAARAGAHGRGFSVVAEEVGKLAEMSGNSATEIQALLDRSQKHVSQIVDSIKSRVSEGQTVSVQAVSTFTDIAEGIRQIATQMRTVDEAVREQEAGIQQVSVAMSQMDSTAQRNSGYAKECSQATGRLREQSQRLTNAISTLQTMVRGSQDDRSPEPDSSLTEKTSSAQKKRKQRAAEHSIKGATRSVSELVEALAATQGNASNNHEEAERPSSNESDSFVPYN